MPRSLAANLAALVRVPNLVMAALGVAIGGVLVQGRWSLPEAVLLSMLSAMGLGAAGNAANDLYDVDADRVNRPERPLAGGGLATRVAIAAGGVGGGLGLLAAWMVGGAVFALACVALPLMLVYSPILKRNGLAGNLTVAAVASLPLVYGAAAAGFWRAGLVPWGLAALLHFAREVVKDLEDVAGDRAAGRRTLPIVRGESAGFVTAAGALVVFVPVALAPAFAGWYGPRYGVLAGLASLGAVGLLIRLLHRRLDGASLALKGLMLLGLAALLWDRL